MDKLHVFIRNDSSGDPWAHCGPLGEAETLKAINHYLEADFESMDEDSMISLSVERMSDEAVAALPEL